MPQKEQELRRRLFWALYLLDSKIGMKLGRPFLIPEPGDEPKLPGDQVDVAVQSGSNFAPLGDNLTWLSFSLQHTVLFRKARACYTAFYERPVTLWSDKSIWDDPASLEAHAEFFSFHMRGLEDWAANLPSALQTKRQNGGRALDRRVSPSTLNRSHHSGSSGSVSSWS